MHSIARQSSSLKPRLRSRCVTLNCKGGFKEEGEMIIVFAPTRRILKPAGFALLAIFLAIPGNLHRTTKRTCRCDGGYCGGQLGVLGGLGCRTA